MWIFLLGLVAGWAFTRFAAPHLGSIGALIRG